MPTLNHFRAKILLGSNTSRKINLLPNINSSTIIIVLFTWIVILCIRFYRSKKATLNNYSKNSSYV